MMRMIIIILAIIIVMNIIQAKKIKKESGKPFSSPSPPGNRKKCYNHYYSAISFCREMLILEALTASNTVVVVGVVALE